MLIPPRSLFDQLMLAALQTNIPIFKLFYFRKELIAISEQ